MILSTLALALLLQTPLPAETLQSRQGLYVGFGIGGARLHFDCNGCPEAGTDFAGYGNARIGAAISPHFTLGLDLRAWHHEGTDDNATSTLLAVNYYPRAIGGTFLTFGAGPAHFDGVDFVDGPSEVAGGWGGVVGIGYDARFDRKLSLTPMLSLLYQDFGTTYIVGSPERKGVSDWLITFGLGLTWH